MLPNLPRENLLDLCRRMFVIRHFEENLVPLHDKGIFGGHYHLYVGQEGTGVPAISCLRADDYLFTTHRNHGHLLARGAEPKKLFAEILGRADGLNKGKGGSFHSVAPSLGFLHSSGVVAGIIPLSTGTAYAAKAQKNGRITVCLFGDGSLEEGAAPEAFNLASLYKLPVLFLCENNGKYGAGRAVAAAQSSSMAAYPLTDLPKAYKIPAQQIDGMDAGLGPRDDFRSRGKNSPRRRTAIRRGANRALSRQRDQLAHGAAADRYFAGMGCEQRAGKSPRMVQHLRSVADLHSRVGRSQTRRPKTKSPPSITRSNPKSPPRSEFAVASPYPKPEEAERELFCLRADYARTCLLRS